MLEETNELNRNTKDNSNTTLKKVVWQRKKILLLNNPDIETKISGIRDQIKEIHQNIKGWKLQGNYDNYEGKDNKS